MHKISHHAWVFDFDSRYFTEDIVGTKAIRAFARRYGVLAPMIEALETLVDSTL